FICKSCAEFAHPSRHSSPFVRTASLSPCTLRMRMVMRAHRENAIPTRYSLLSKLRDWDDQESWKVFFDTYWGMIYSAAIRSGLTDAEAEDVGQETVIWI